MKTRSRFLYCLFRPWYSLISPVNIDFHHQKLLNKQHHLSRHITHSKAESVIKCIIQLIFIALETRKKIWSTLFMLMAKMSKQFDVWPTLIALREMKTNLNDIQFLIHLLQFMLEVNKLKLLDSFVRRIFEDCLRCVETTFWHLNGW